MGVQGLWEILKDVKTNKKLCDLKDQILAVDLATWICEAESVGQMKNAISKPYLRNLYFRITAFTKNGTRLVFVTDGKAPDLKWKTMAHRLDTRQDVQKGTNAARGSRSRLNARFNECCQLLDQLGIPWIKSEGEAEATCAALNEASLVHGCLTNDSDAFLYGAKTVYRNLSSERNDIDVECYELSEIETKLHLNRKSLIALGLLLGCDYSPQGVPGVGKKQATVLLSSWTNTDPLEKMKSWRSETVTSPTLMKKPSHCSTCNHIGSKRDHSKYGCKVCGKDCGSETSLPVDCSCDWHEQEYEQRKNSLENGVRMKALQVDNFPDPKIIHEFTRKKLGSNLPRLSPRQPTLFGAVQYLCEKLEWSVAYAVDKVLPLLTYWLLMNDEKVDEISFQRIIRTRIKNKISMFEIEWFLVGFEDITSAITLEQQDMVTRKFPEVTNNFLEEIEATKKKKPKSKTKGVKEPDKATSKMTDFFKMAKAKEVSTKLSPSSEITPENSRKTKSNSETSKNTEINLKPAPIDDMSLLTTAMASFDITSTEKEDTGFKCSKSKPDEPFRDITNSDRLGMSDSPTDHSFGLNFSLEGCQTPYKLGSQNDSFDMFCDLTSPSNSPCTQSKNRESSIRPFKHLSTTPIIQPTTDESHQPPNPPSSPVFLTLAERIRLRKASTTVTDD